MPGLPKRWKSGSGDSTTKTFIVSSAVWSVILLLPICLYSFSRASNSVTSATNGLISTTTTARTSSSIVAEKPTTANEPRRHSHNGLADPWRQDPVTYQHCYHHGNNWRDCAGDHLLYPKIKNPQDLYKRSQEGQPMCLYEPLCWMQLDWRNNDPPDTKGTCDLNHDLQFYDWSLHDGTMASLSTTIEKAMREMVSIDAKTQQKPSLEVTLCNVKTSKAAIRNYHYKFTQCQKISADQPDPPQIGAWKVLGSDDLAEEHYNWLRDNATHARQADAHLTAFIPPHFEFLMAWNRTIVVNALHRVNMNRCSRRESQQTFDNLVRLASSGPSGRYPNGPTHIMAPGYVHDVEYIRHYTGIRSIYLPFSLFNALPPQDYRDVYTNNTESNPYAHKFIWNTRTGYVAPVELKDHISFHLERPYKYELVDLMKYRGAIVLPYSITNTKSLEQYELNIPMFAPTPKFAMELKLFHDRTATYGPYCAGKNFTNDHHPGAHNSSPFEFSPNARHTEGDPAEDELFWISFSEIYLWPCVHYFDSWSELVETLNKLKDDDYKETSKCMKQANLWRKHEMDTNLCWALQLIRANSSPSGEERSMPVEVSYQQALAQLYGNISKVFDY